MKGVDSSIYLGQWLIDLREKIYETGPRKKGVERKMGNSGNQAVARIIPKLGENEGRTIALLFFLLFDLYLEIVIMMQYKKASLQEAWTEF